MMWMMLRRVCEERGEYNFDDFTRVRWAMLLLLLILFFFVYNFGPRWIYMVVEEKEEAEQVHGLGWFDWTLWLCVPRRRSVGMR